MVCELGMSENLGPLTFGKKEEMVFLGREIASHKDYSEETAERIDQEVRLIVEGAYNRAMTLLRDNMEKLQLIAKSLLEREVLDGEEMNKLLRGEKLEPLKPVEAEPPQDSTPVAEGQAARRPESGLEGFPPPAPRPAGA
jgi:cell division protease FtsH